jgi:hypothetical protein
MRLGLTGSLSPKVFAFVGGDCAPTAFPTPTHGLQLQLQLRSACHPVTQLFAVPEPKKYRRETARFLHHFLLWL